MDLLVHGPAHERFEGGATDARLRLLTEVLTHDGERALVRASGEEGEGLGTHRRVAVMARRSDERLRHFGCVEVPQRAYG